MSDDCNHRRIMIDHRPAPGPSGFVPHWMCASCRAEFVPASLLSSATARAEEAEAKLSAKDRMIQAYPTLAEFFGKYALGPKVAPSCLVCGHALSGSPAIQHAELPGVVVCFPCRDAVTKLDRTHGELINAQTRLGKIHELMTKNHEPIAPGAAIGILIATLEQVIELSTVSGTAPAGSAVYVCNCGAEFPTPEERLAHYSNCASFAPAGGGLNADVIEAQRSHDAFANALDDELKRG